ncbi:hypothetical protein CMK11_01940 [Candidatus Poribacteria bacterium]|jgi:hypothetical protein|nr:hypothetical protein [Candidatus Poribacteria bacterium]
MSQRVLVACCVLAFGVSLAFAKQHSEDFDGPVRPAVWSIRNADAPNSIATQGGWLEVTVGVDQLVWPWDVPRTNAPMLLLAPPVPDDKFTLETRVRVQHPGGGTWGSIAGLGIIRKDGTAAWIWGLWNVDSVALREHDVERIGEVTWVRVFNTDEAWLGIAKDHDEYTFRHRLHADDDWIETTERPFSSPGFVGLLASGEYLVGLIAAGGGEETRVQFDYFDSPELGVVDVKAGGKLPLTWAELRTR